MESGGVRGRQQPSLCPTANTAGSRQSVNRCCQSLDSPIHHARQRAALSPISLLWTPAALIVTHQTPALTGNLSVCHLWGKTINPQVVVVRQGPQPKTSTVPFTHRCSFDTLSSFSRLLVATDSSICNHMYLNKSRMVLVPTTQRGGWVRNLVLRL